MVNNFATLMLAVNEYFDVTLSILYVVPHLSNGPLEWEPLLIQDLDRPDSAESITSKLGRAMEKKFILH